MMSEAEVPGGGGGGHSRVLVVRGRAALTTPFFRPRFPFSRYYAS